MSKKKELKKAAKKLAEKEAAAKAALKVADQKPEVKPPELPPSGNLCDDCAYIYGECEGKPEFASEEGADDRVVKCPGFVNAAAMPTAEELRKKEEADQGGQPPEPSQEEPKALDLAADMLDEFGQAVLHSRADEVREELTRRYGDEQPSAEDAAKTAVMIVQEIIEKEGGPSEGVKEEPKSKMPKPDRPDLKRFVNDDTDYGKCPSCKRELKRTAYSLYVDAIRCTNPRCRNYREIVGTVSTGIK